MKIKQIYIAFACLLFALPAGAQNGWTLRQCIEYAIENNVSIQRTENVAEQSKVNMNTAKWARLPNLTGSASYDYNWGRSDSGNNLYVDRDGSNSSFRLNTSVPLFTGFELPNQYSLSKLNMMAAIEDLNKAKDDLSINIASAYVQVLFNQELAMVAREQVNLSKEQLKRMLSLEEVGKASPAEVAEARSRVAQDEMSAVQADNNYNLSLLDLTQMLELPTPEGFSLAFPEEASINLEKLTPPDAIFLGAITSKPEILAAQYRLEGSEKNIRIAQSGYYPTLSFGAGLSSGFYTNNGHAGQSFFTQLDNRLNKALGFSLSIPIFNRFATRNRVRTARLQQLNYSMQLDETKKGLYKEIQQAWYSAVAAESKYNSSVAAVNANEESFRLMGEKFENGKATSLEYNEAKLNLMKALSDRIQAKYDYMFRSKVLNFYKGEPIE